MLSNLAKPVLAVTQSWPAVLVLRVTDRLGKGMRTALDTADAAMFVTWRL